MIFAACKIDVLDQWCLRMLLGIKWYQFVRNDDVRRLTKQPKLTAIIQSRRLTLFGHIMRLDDNADAKRILLASPPADWRRQLGRPRITWLSTIQQDLKHHHLTLPEAADLAQNRPLWRMMSTYVATQLWVACQKRRRMLCISAANAVMWYLCLSVTFVDCVKTNKNIFKILSPLGRTTVLVLPYKMAWQYSDGYPHNGGIKCRWGRQKSRFWANIWLHRMLWTAPASSAIHLAATNHGKFITLVAGERLSLLMVGNNDEVYDKKPQRYAEDNIMQW